MILERALHRLEEDRREAARERAAIDHAIGEIRQSLTAAATSDRDVVTNDPQRVHAFVTDRPLVAVAIVSVLQKHGIELRMSRPGEVVLPRESERPRASFFAGG